MGPSFMGGRRPTVGAVHAAPPSRSASPPGRACVQRADRLAGTRNGVSGGGGDCGGLRIWGQRQPCPSACLPPTPPPSPPFPSLL